MMHTAPNKLKSSQTEGKEEASSDWDDLAFICFMASVVGGRQISAES